MSFRVRDIQFIHNNQLNSSVSKQQYSIPKAERFRNIKSQLSCQYYNIPSTNTHKAPSFGISDRPSPFVGILGTPSPNRYTIKQLLKQKLQFKFPLGRQQCKNINFLKTNKNPGPGAYDPNPEYIQNCISKGFTIRLKTQYQTQKNIQIIPGPGKYSIKQTWLDKDKILSSDKKRGTPIIKPGKQRSEVNGMDKSIDVPYYNPKRTYTGQQTFNKTGFSLGKCQRFQRRVITSVPGPGYYDRFSEFI